MIFLDFYAAEFDVDCVISNNFYGMIQNGTSGQKRS